MRRSLIAANWKMNLTFDEALSFVGYFKEFKFDTKKIDVLIAPPFLYLSDLGRALKKINKRVVLAAQNIHFESSGAYTGEVSAEMLKSVGINWTIIGHSERRQYFGDNDIIVNKKVKKAIENGLNVILCVGEQLPERDAGIEKELVISQLGMALSGVGSADMSKIVIAYEPVWAIGTGKTAKSSDAEEMHKSIREFIKSRYGRKIANNVRIIYGGSVKPENISDLMSMPNIDGALVGGASLKFESFAKIINY
ncbi:MULTISPECIES: triose-phosphate isomerase [Calditerrivibrio]|jgi:triosephosphate isomerase|uniref:Triosephosphate isomerase n=1 Tax=Calditerrivibrio nitroreducens TaxID=477976 RepID=A0A2J6WPR4_9BACT|nr:MAG: triose-phosphate isomerase [Calditerrivibrio nitroreducens]